MKTAGIVLGVFGAWVLYILVRGNGAVSTGTIVPSGQPGDPATQEAVTALHNANAANTSPLNGQAVDFTHIPHSA